MIGAGGNLQSDIIRTPKRVPHNQNLPNSHEQERNVSQLYATILMGHFYTLKAILQPTHLTRRVDVVLAATSNLSSSGQPRACSTVAINNENMALKLRPSVLSAPTLMGHFYTLKAILQPTHTTRR